MTRIKEAIKKQEKEWKRKNKGKKHGQKMWKCPRCGKEVPDNFFCMWEHVIKGCKKKE